MQDENQTSRILATKRFGVFAEIRTGPRVATTLPRHLHEELQIILSEKRLISYGIRGTQVLSPLRSVFVVEPEVPHSGHVHKFQSEWGVLRTFLIPQSSFTHHLGQQIQQSSLTFASPVLTPRVLLNRLRLMHDALTGDQDDLESESVVSATLSMILSLVKTPPAKTFRRRSDAKMRLVRDFLGDNPARQTSLSQLAASVDLSPFHVLREFRLQYGMSPHAFRIQLRVGKARDLLLAKVPISEAALLSGFSDHAHLTRTFHKIVGVPPSRFQKAISFKTGR